MPKTVQGIEIEIAKLQQKREALQTKEALELSRQARKILGEDFFPALALTVLKETWGAASPTQQKEWQNTAASFQGAKRRLLKD